MIESDVITEQVIRARLDGIVREMQAAVLRTGYSTIIRESHDFSAGITDREGNVVGQYSPAPVHLGAYPDCVQGVLQFYDYSDMRDGDCFLSSHPYYSGCPHPNDMVVVLPVFHEGDIVGFCASMGHKSDIGGQSPGSRSAISRDVFGDGFQVMPVKFQQGGENIKEVEQFLRANSRTPELVIGDLAAQAGALRSIGAARTKDLMREYGKKETLAAFEGLGARTEARCRQAFGQWEDGVCEAETFVDDIANPGRTIRIHVAAIKRGNKLTLDFSGCGDQSDGPMNVRPPFIRGLTSYAVIAMIDSNIPNNFGLARAVDCKFREGSLICPSFPAPTGFYSMTIPMVEDVMFEALSQLAGRPAVAHNAPSGMIVLGGQGGSGRRYVQYEIIISANGAHDGGDGWTGTGHSWSGGAKYANVEILESEFPVEMTRFQLAPDTGGAGEYRGGLSLWREYRVNGPSRYAGGTVRSSSPPSGVLGGGSGIAGAIITNPGTEREQRYDGLISNIALEPGDVVRSETGSGGGVGDPLKRDRSRVIQDLRNGWITADAAVEAYGLNAADAAAAIEY